MISFSFQFRCIYFICIETVFAGSHFVQAFHYYRVLCNKKDHTSCSTMSKFEHVGMFMCLCSIQVIVGHCRRNPNNLNYCTIFNWYCYFLIKLETLYYQFRVVFAIIGQLIIKIFAGECLGFTTKCYISICFVIRDVCGHYTNSS